MAYGVNDEQRQATAKLIATAPELLEELQTTNDFILALYSTINNNSFNKETAQQLMRDRMAKQLSIIDKATK